jgi:hypothetical protein
VVQGWRWIEASTWLQSISGRAMLSSSERRRHPAYACLGVGLGHSCYASRQNGQPTWSIYGLRGPLSLGNADGTAPSSSCLYPCFPATR